MFKIEDTQSVNNVNLSVANNLVKTAQGLEKVEKDDILLRFYKFIQAHSQQKYSLYHETSTRTGIKCKKISLLYAPPSCSWLTYANTFLRIVRWNFVEHEYSRLCFCQLLYLRNFWKPKKIIIKDGMLFKKCAHSWWGFAEGIRQVVSFTLLGFKWSVKKTFYRRGFTKFYLRDVFIWTYF